jgi:succinate-semialdehyde dehydrogenase/glutarate-semialdehyde dehydrogenase
VTDEMRCRHEETFGPVLSLVPFDSVDEAIESANATEFGLAAAVWTKDVKHGLRLAERLEAGTVDINESYFATWGSIDVPQGGMGESGVGRRNGRVGLLRFTEAQGIAAQRLHGIHPPRGMEHEQFAKVLTLSLRAMAKLRIR